MVYNSQCDILTKQNTALKKNISCLYVTSDPVLFSILCRSASRSLPPPVNLVSLTCILISLNVYDAMHMHTTRYKTAKLEIDRKDTEIQRLHAQQVSRGQGKTR
jgi:hypothetical protein